MCEKCKQVGELAREVYESKGLHPDKDGHINCMVRTDEAVHIIGDEAVFFFQKGIIVQADIDGVRQVDNLSVAAIPIENLMDYVISILTVYDNAMSLNLIPHEKQIEDLHALLEYVAGR